MHREFDGGNGTYPGVFRRWRGDLTVQSLGTNHGAKLSAIQSWYRFKEAFTPEIVMSAIDGNPTKVRTCVDPFAGSGTTALVCQMAGIESHSYEVNPFLYDLISSKTYRYDPRTLRDRIAAFAERALSPIASPYDVSRWPRTFVEPGHKGRWLFDEAVAHQLAAIVGAIEDEEDRTIRQFLKVAAGSILVPASNAVINGKGRRYRKNWRDRPRDNLNLLTAMLQRLEVMQEESGRFDDRFSAPTHIHFGDVRSAEGDFPEFDLAVFSPPYPNSFDYTDVYNLELWTLGYLQSRAEDRALRSGTLSSHVQLTRAFQVAPNGSSELIRCIEQLQLKQSDLWNKHLPRMIGSYFAELSDLLKRLLARKRPGGRVHIVVGDSRYAGVDIFTATILRELILTLGGMIVDERPLRDMRSSPQQGGQATLRETLLVIE